MNIAALSKPASAGRGPLAVPVAADQAVVLTPPGTAALAVVRLSGPSVGAFLARHFSGPSPARRCVHGQLRDGESVLDDPVVVRLDEQTADLSLHGGTWVVRSVLELARRGGFHVVGTALPLPERVADGTLLWREVLQHLPLARTEAAVRMLLAQPAAWDEMIRRDDRAEHEQVLHDVGGRWMLSLPTVAIVGPANVGKSTLANQLFAQQRSITADLPGTTRDWVGETADIGGLAVMLVDTPGERETEDAIERAAITAGRERVRSADLVLLVLDASRPLDAAQRAMLAANPKALLIANKSGGVKSWTAPDAIPTVATIGAGIDAVRAAVLRRFNCEPRQPLQARWWTDRQRHELEQRANPARTTAF